jgi:hypothetical protein
VHAHVYAHAPGTCACRSDLGRRLRRRPLRCAAVVHFAEIISSHAVLWIISPLKSETRIVVVMWLGKRIAVKDVVDLRLHRPEREFASWPAGSLNQLSYQLQRGGR